MSSQGDGESQSCAECSLDYYGDGTGGRMRGMALAYQFVHEMEARERELACSNESDSGKGSPYGLRQMPVPVNSRVIDIVTSEGQANPTLHEESQPSFFVESSFHARGREIVCSSESDSDEWIPGGHHLMPVPAVSQVVSDATTEGQAHLTLHPPTHPKDGILSQASSNSQRLRAPSSDNISNTNRAISNGSGGSVAFATGTPERGISSRPESPPVSIASRPGLGSNSICYTRQCSNLPGDILRMSHPPIRGGHRTNMHTRSHSVGAVRRTESEDYLNMSRAPRTASPLGFSRILGYSGGCQSLYPNNCHVLPRERSCDFNSPSGSGPEGTSEIIFGRMYQAEMQLRHATKENATLLRKIEANQNDLKIMVQAISSATSVLAPTGHVTTANMVIGQYITQTLSSPHNVPLDPKVLLTLVIILAPFPTRIKTQKELPSIRFYKESDWNAAQKGKEKEKKNKSNIGPAIDTSGPFGDEKGVIPYLEEEDGSICDLSTSNAVRTAAMAFCNTLHDIGMLPKTWEGMTHVFAEKLNHYLYSKYPQVGYCEHFWKAQMIAQELISSY